MGLYRTGTTFVAMIFGLAFAPLLPVLYSLLSRAQYDANKLVETLMTVSHGIALVSLPVGFFLYALGDDIGILLFGSSWHGIGEVISIMGLLSAFSWLVGANGEAYRAMGKPHVETWANTFLLLIYLTVYLAAVQFGLHVFLEARLALSLFGVFIHICVALVVLGVAMIKWLFPNIVAVSALSALIVSHVNIELGSGGIDLVVLSLLFLVTTLIGLALTERSFLRQLRGLRFTNS